MPAEQTDLRAWATTVLLSEIDHPHDDTLCRIQGRCLLREALRASAERLAADGSQVVSVEEIESGVCLAMKGAMS